MRRHFIVSIDEDQFPGAMHGEQRMLQDLTAIIIDRIGRYNPHVRIFNNNTSTDLLRILDITEGTNCIACKNPEGNDPFHTFWATAEKNGMEPGMYHDTCFWSAVSTQQKGN